MIKEELSDLVIARYTFQSVQKIISENPALHIHSSFYDYFAQTYVSHVVIGLRRQIKIDQRSISMARLLAEMIDTPEVLTRAHFVSLYADSAIPGYADTDFNQFAKAGAPNVDPDLIRVDLERLKSTVARCEDFADKRVAHRDTREPKALPTFNEVDECIEVLDKLWVRYFLLFHAQGMDSLLPTWQYDWTAIFRVPWIIENST
ncbi:MAG: hypothetical protein ACYC7G_07720 [Rudaea sp.]